MTTKGLVALRAFRGLAIAAPLGGVAACAGKILEQNYQRALCANVPGADFIGDGVGLLNITILILPWLVIAACQFVGWRQKLRFSDGWRLIVIVYCITYGLAVWEYVLPPVADAKHCSLGFWRHQLAHIGMWEIAAVPLAVVSVLVAAIAYSNIRRAKARTPAQVDEP